MIVNKGLCSVSFRLLSVEEIIRQVKENGLNCIEWGGDVHVPVNDTENAERVRKLTLEAGLKILSFGSYYKCESAEGFEAVSKAAELLGARIIRIWAGTKDAEQYSQEEFSRLISVVRQCADIAKTRKQSLAFEFHFGTYNNSPTNAKRLLKAVDRENVKTYWQPMYWRDYESNEGEIDINVKSIKELYDDIVGVHIYGWKKYQRFPLVEYLEKWKAYDKALPDTNGYLEFFLNDKIEQFMEDAKVLRDKF